MPMDSYAQTMLQLSGRRSLHGEAASSWLARTLFTADDGDEDALFLINFPSAVHLEHPEIIEATTLQIFKKQPRRPVYYWHC